MTQLLPFRIQILSVVVSIALLLFVARLIRKGRLREEYALLWLISAALLILFSFWREGLQFFADLLGVYYPPSLMFMGAIFVIVVFLVHLSVVISKLQYQQRILAQEIAMMRATLEKMTPQDTPSA